MLLCSSTAFIHASGALGPVLGYALGALLLQFYVDSFSHEVLISAGHPQWIGAWWGGFIICGLLLLLLAFPFLGYPRVLVQEKRRLLENKTKEQLLSEDERPVDTQYGRSIKGRFLWSIKGTLQRVPSMAGASKVRCYGYPVWQEQ